MPPIVLRDNPTPEDDSWVFRTVLPKMSRPGMGLHLSFSPEKITLDRTLFPQNRILQSDDVTKFVLVSFEKLRFPERPARAAQEYLIRLFAAGLFLNGVQYRFYGHSNSQLRSRSCFLREATSDEELDRRIYALGDFLSIKTPAKRAKRIGLLFSEAKIDWILNPRWTKDIDDIVENGEMFSDGCGLISRKFAMQLSRHKRIVFHGKPYTPSVYQIRYRGYKGVLMLDLRPEIEHVHFRKSQKKFTATQNDTFSVVDYSNPYAYGRLNNDIVVLLSSLGVSNEVFLKKQEEYHQWLQAASDDWEAAFDLLCASNKYEAAERLLLEGLDSKTARQNVFAIQNSELASIRKNDRLRVRTLVPKSRLLFGVCDPFGVLRPGEVHVRITVPRKGVTTLTNVDVMVVRNPCLYSGDILKLRAVANRALDHLVDCVVFASRGKRAAPSMSSGGDLDGDKFLVLWDSDLVPTRIAESYDYPAPPERKTNSVNRQDLAKHFASYNSMTMGRIAALHQKWVRLSPNGAMSAECQELNALYSLVVDGGSVKIPERLAKLPTPQDANPYVLDVLHSAAAQFAENFRQIHVGAAGVEPAGLDRAVAEDMIARLLSSQKASLTEYEVVSKAAGIARKYAIPMRPYVTRIDFSALSISEKYAVSSMLGLTPEDDPYVWNSLIRSEILRPKDLEERNLGGPLHLQRLYSSAIQGRAAFFEYLKEAVQHYNRRMVILKTDQRFASGIFLRGAIEWDEDHVIDDNVMVCSFLAQSTEILTTYKRGVKGWILSCTDSGLQLFNRQRGDTFIFITRPALSKNPGPDIVTSIALQKFSDFVRRQCGRMNRQPVVDLEIHVVSNRDRVAQQLFDLRFEHVATEEKLSRFDHRPSKYVPNSITSVDWAAAEGVEQRVFVGSREDATEVLAAAPPDALLEHLRFAIHHRAEDRIFWTFDALLEKDELPVDAILTAMQDYPSLAYSSLKNLLEKEGVELPEAMRPRLAIEIARQIIRCAGAFGMAALAGLERLNEFIGNCELPIYLDLLWLTSQAVRSPPLVQEIMLVMHDARVSAREFSGMYQYVHHHALGTVFDRAEDAADACPCDEQGRPRRQKVAPISAKLCPIPPPKNSEPAEEQQPQAQERYVIPTRIMANIRVDLPTSIRIHSHVRLRVSSPPEHSTLPAAVVDGIVIRSSRGELFLDIVQPLPPEWSTVDWRLHQAGSVVTSRAMLDALQKLAIEGRECCAFNDIISGQAEQTEGAPVEDTEDDLPASLNPSQRESVASARLGWFTLIWGPPGTGKTTVMVQILLRFLRMDPDASILMAASTHNAVDNVLERLVTENDHLHVLADEQILRAATEISRVHKALQKYTVDARLGGSVNDDPRLIKKAEKRVNDARIVFTTCTGASLGILRKAAFSIVLIDEASQISEPAALIPLVKGCSTAVMVGDHVQLRPTVKPMGKALEFDRSMFERLYTGLTYKNMCKTMLQIQYRFSADVARFPSMEFYEGRLETGNPNTEAISALALSSFPWPLRDGLPFPVVFVPCSSEEDFGRSSKGNEGQVNLVKHIVGLLRTPKESSEDASAGIANQLAQVSLTALSPYSRHVKMLSQALSTSITTSTIDGFQGRESEIIIFSTVRSNIDGDLGFVDDPRRLNVAWTRPKVGLIVVGDRRTLETSPLWKRALQSCVEVGITVPTVE